MKISAPIKAIDEVVEFVASNSVPENNPYAPGAMCCYKPPIGETLMREMTPQIEAVVGKKLYPVSTFVRVHDHGTWLGAHFDRRGLEWTLSIPVEIDEPWPIDVFEDWEWHSRLARIGEGVLINGTNVAHKRDPYPGQRASIMTLSWSTDPAYQDDTLPAAAASHLRIPGLLPRDMIARLYMEFEELVMGPGHISHRNIPSSDRANEIGWLRRPQWQWLYNHVRDRLALVNSMCWRLDAGGETTDELQLTRYKPGDWYPWHVDCDPGAADQCRFRSLSTSILLRNPIAGGGLELDDGGLIPLEPGDAVIFPAVQKHRALEVTEGVRDSLVLWLSKSQGSTA